jgi:hypothetical protein
MKLWQKLGVVGVSALLFLLLLVALTGRFSRKTASVDPPHSWNSRAIASTFAGVRVREIDPTDAAVVFLYDVDNRTNTDYQLRKGPTVVMTRLKSSGSLSSEKLVALSSSVFVPAKNRTRIALEVLRHFAWSSHMDAASEDRIRDLVAGELVDVDGFVLFDEEARYQIDLPGGWTEIQQESASPPRGN